MKRPVMIIVPLVIIVGLFGTAFFAGDQGIITLYRSHLQKQNLKKEIAATKNAIDSLTKETALLKNDTAYIERIAREKFGMAHPGEKMYKFIEEK